MYKVTVIKGDGIGPEIVDCTLKVLDKVCAKHAIDITYDVALMGGEALDAVGVPLPDETVEKCKASDAVFLGAVGGEKWDVLPGHLRPEAGLLGIRGALGLYANLRPAVMYEPLKDASPLSPRALENGVDVMVVRELTGGIYFGERGSGGTGETEYSFDTEKYSVYEVRRIAKKAFDLAMGRKKKLTCVDKANVLESSRLFRKVVGEVAKDYPDVELNYMYADNCAMQLVRNPGQFDVIVTTNMFGDILSDEASMVTGSLGMLPSASLGDGNFGLYEPIHGSAPDIAGKGIANPMATILSAAMMLRYSFGKEDAAKDVEQAVERVLGKGYRTADLAGGGKYLTSDEITQMIMEEI